MRLDREPQFGELQDDASVGFQNSRKFAEKRNVIRDVFHQRDGYNDAETSIPERKMLSSGLNSWDAWVYESNQIVAIRVDPDEMVDSAQENRNPARAAPEVDNKSPFAERGPREIPDQGRVAIVASVVESE